MWRRIFHRIKLAQKGCPCCPCCVPWLFWNITNWLAVFSQSLTFFHLSFLLLVYAMVFTTPIYAEPAFMNFMTLGGSWSLSYTVRWLNYALVLVMKFYDLDNFNWKLWFTCSPFIIVLFGVNAYDILEGLCLNNLICKFLVFLHALPLIYGS